MQLTYLHQVKNQWRILDSKHRFGLLFFSLLLTIGGSTLLAEPSMNIYRMIRYAEKK
jgi:hypothetical protein